MSEIERDLNDFEKTELQECHSVIRTILTIRTQILVFFGTATITIFGFGLKEGKLSLLVGSIISMIFFFVVDFSVRSNLHSYIYRGYLIEKKFSSLGIIKGYILMHTRGRKFLEEGERISVINDPDEAMRELFRIAHNPFSFHSSILSVMIFLIIFVEILLCLILYHKMNWPLF